MLKKKYKKNLIKRVLYFNDVAFGVTYGDYSFRREEEQQIKYKITHLNSGMVKNIYCYDQIELFENVDICIEKKFDVDE